MREIAVLSFISLDGVAQGPVADEEDTSGGFTHCGWARKYLADVMDYVNSNLMSAPVSFLFGRKTYELFAAHWPEVTDSAHGDLLNHSQKYVATSTLRKAEWQNTEILNGDLIEEIKRIKAGDGSRIQVHGSTSMVQTLIAHDLVDELRLLTFPLILGSGKRLFGDRIKPENFLLTDSHVIQNGVIAGIYRR